MKRILLTMVGILLSTGARAEISTAVVPIRVSPVVPFSSVVCYVANTSVYPRTARVILYSQTGAILNEALYELAGKQTMSVTSSLPASLPIGDGVRCAVTGIPSVGEAGLRASLCVAAVLAPPLTLESVCLQAN
jgi:hypothetical protein